MLRGKVLLVLALYIILGAIAFLNFGFHHYMTGNVGLRSIVNDPIWKNFDESIEETQTAVMQESQGFPSDKETNN